MKSTIIFLLLILICNSSAQTGSTLVFNEIMFYPSSGNNELIEIYNASTTESVDLNGYKIKYYSSSPDFIADAGEGTILNPGSYAVILEADYDFI
ncbi:MAG TPA: lamin tail domain-containing protein, partial [Ignavibacteriaceae bacterium]